MIRFALHAPELQTIRASLDQAQRLMTRGADPMALARLAVDIQNIADAGGHNAQVTATMKRAANAVLSAGSSNRGQASYALDQARLGVEASSAATFLKNHLRIEL